MKLTLMRGLVGLGRLIEKFQRRLLDVAVNEGNSGRRVQLEQDLATGPTTPVRLHPSLAQVYRRQVERLQDALNEPEIRDEALQILRGLVERVSIGPAQNGLEVEIVGEIAKMVELGIGNKAKQTPLDEMMTRSVKVVAGVGFAQERTRWELRRSA